MQPLESIHGSAGRDASPVGLTVHSLAVPALAQDQRTWRGRLHMLLILACCATPVLASYWAYYVVRPKGRVNYGTLIEPQRPLPTRDVLPLVDLQGRAVDPQSLKGHWLLMVVADGRCDAVCQSSLYRQHQMHTSLGKERDRVQRVWLVDDDVPIPVNLTPALQGTTVLRAPAGALTRWLQPEAGHALSSSWYLIDPLGHWMMRFPVPGDDAKIKRDLDRLLRASDAWDQAGR